MSRRDPLVVFSQAYAADVGGHVFATEKFALVADTVRREPGVTIVEPPPFSREDLLLAHTADWVDRALEGRLTRAELDLLELPWSKELARAHALAVSGTLLACRHALATGLGLHCGGGSHHAFPDHGEGFCAFNDLACAVLRLRAEGRVRRAVVIDLDVHQGNGTNAVFKDVPDVFTFSIHQEGIYPERPTPGSRDVLLRAETGDKEYLARLAEELPNVLREHMPELAVYQAGADVYEGDTLGGLALTAEGIRRRDEAVFIECRERGIPVAVTLGGGYAEELEDTVMLHAQTLLTGMKVHG